MPHPQLLLHFLIPLTLFSAYAQETAPFPPPSEDVSSIALLAEKEEPGERLVIRGTVYHSDGNTPYEGLVIYLYQTDASGVYNLENGSWREPRLRGCVKTGPEGSYEIRTIKPGSYPGSRNPAHIHAVIQLPGRPPQWIDDFLFEGDPYLTEDHRSEAKQKDRFSHILRLSRNSDGAYTGTRDIRIPE